jgi:hypothetical protein
MRPRFERLPLGIGCQGGVCDSKLSEVLGMQVGYQRLCNVLGVIRHMPYIVVVRRLDRYELNSLDYML